MLKTNFIFFPSEKIDPDLCDVWSDLYEACCESNWEEAWNLIRSGNVDGTWKSPKKNTPLHAVAQCKGPPELVAALVKCGVNIQAYNTSMDTPLMLAAGYGAPPQLIQAFLDAGADITKGDGPLHMAAQEKLQPESLKILLVEGEKRGVVNTFSPQGATPLHLAIMNRAPLETIRLFLKHGADPSLQLKTWDFAGFDCRRLAKHLDNLDALVAELDDPQITGKYECSQCYKSSDKMTRCSRCKVAYYCDANCQRKHYPQHKLECSPSIQCKTCKQRFKELDICGACQSVSYCSRNCQKADWPKHKAFCKQKQQAVAATEAASREKEASS